ncbi:MAG: peptidyl-prolyl cis-trans isomerase, partial [Nitrospirae bacterium]|nr:peptidyl-prolyl cis-trans isomerase [Nitrospirota bacterium]
MSKEQGVKSINFCVLCYMLYAISFLFFLGGCASFSQKKNTLAVVNGEPIAEDDLKYSLQIAHRREDLSSAGELNLSKFIQKLVDDRLLIQEARSMGMEEYPEVKQAIQAYIIRESVTRLYQEEIINKVTVSEDEIRNYYKSIRGKEAPDEELEILRKGIEKNIRKQKEKERGDEYLKYLKEHQTIKVDEEILSSIKLYENNVEIDTTKEGRVLAEVNGFSLTVKDFVAIAKSYPKKPKEDIINDWIDRKVIDSEALKRHYELKTDLKDMVSRYRGQLLKNTFIKRIIIPQVSISENMLKEYYSSHKDYFTTPPAFKIQYITVKTKEDAEDVINNLRNGADFSWLAKKRSIDPSAQDDRNVKWLTKLEMQKPIKKVIETLKPGETSQVLEVDSQYRIIKLLDRKEGEVEDFARVKNKVYKMAFE